MAQSRVATAQSSPPHNLARRAALTGKRRQGTEDGMFTGQVLSTILFCEGSDWRFEGDTLWLEPVGTDRNAAAKRVAARCGRYSETAR